MWLARPRLAAARHGRRVAQQALQRNPPAAMVAPAVSRLPPERRATEYKNADGMRIDDGRYTSFKKAVREKLGEESVVDDPVRTFAFGTDASFYRLNPQAVVRVKCGVT